MKTRFILILIQLLEAQAQLVLKQLTEGQTLELSCSLLQHRGGVTGLHLYHRSPRSQTTLLSMAESGKFRFDPVHRWRLQLCGGLDDLQVNVTVSQLQRSDSGLYMWELSYKENVSIQTFFGPQEVFLLVEGRGNVSQCSLRYTPLILSIFSAAGLLLLIFSCLVAEKCVKARRHHRSQPSIPIYEEMTQKHQTAGLSQNNREAPSHLEEVSFPLYANPNILPPQDNYYACPRQLALRAYRDFCPKGAAKQQEATQAAV
ncbi:uncharacterized protein [Antennarius striatus]|uniref:uncharacterized protein n=1 Tax=Antennarius striatus TaxID=241820 RepID=UPI0035B21176